MSGNIFVSCHCVQSRLFFLVSVQSLMCAVLQSYLLRGSVSCHVVESVLIWIQCGVKMTPYLLRDW